MTAPGHAGPSTGPASSFVCPLTRGRVCRMLNTIWYAWMNPDRGSAPMAQYYLSRGGKTYGPYTEDHLRQMATAGQIVRDDLLAAVGAKAWQKAADVPGLFPARRTPPPPPPVPAAKAAPAAVTVQLACFSCFNEVTLCVPVGTPSAPCPSCGSSLAIEAAPKQDGRPAQAAAFKGIGDDVAERVQRMADRAAAEEANAALTALQIARILGS